MGIPIATERRLLAQAELEAVEQTHYPQICALDRDALIEIARRVRAFRARARDIARRQRREMRGKADPRGARPAADDTGSALKAQVLAAALRRVNREIRRHEKAQPRASQGEIARRALELKRRNRVRHHPGAGRTAREGMRAIPNRGPTVETDPREIGRVSQFVKAGQARRDG